MSGEQRTNRENWFAATKSQPALLEDESWLQLLDDVPDDDPSPVSDASDAEFSGLGLVAPPGEPMVNARLLLNEVFTDQVHGPLLATHRDTFRKWNGHAWPSVEDAHIDAIVWKMFEHRKYRKGDRLKKFAPTGYKVGNIVKAVNAITFVDGSVEMPSWLDGDDPPSVEILPVANGLLHIPTKRLLAPSARFFNAYGLPYAYDPDAPPPERFIEFIDELWSNDPTARDAVQEFFGYLVSGDTSLQKIFFIVGPNGPAKAPSPG